MIIKEVSLENFLSHRSTKIELAAGINIFIGQNGSGKSSMFEAIKVAIFGPADSERKRLISYGEDRSSISVTFSKGEHTYTVVRELELKRDRESTRTAYIDMDGKRIVDGSTAVSEEFQKIVGISKSAFINSVYVDQGQMDSLIKEKPAERKNIFNEIIGLKYYDRVNDIVNEMYRKMTPEMQEKSSLRDMRVKLATDKSDLKRHNEQLDLKIKELNSNIEEQEAEVEMIQSKITQLEAKLSNLNSIKEKADEIKNTITDHEKALNQLKTKNDELVNVDREINDLKNSDLYKHGQDLSSYEMSMAEFDRLKFEEKKILARIDQIDKIEQSLKQLEEQRNSIDPILKELEANESRKNELASDEVMYNANQVALKSNVDTLKSLEENIKKAESLIKSRTKLEEINVSSVEKRIEELNADLSLLREEQGKEKGAIHTCNENIRALNEKLAGLSGQTVCPLCGQDLTKEHMLEIEAQYRNDIKENETAKQATENHLRALDTKSVRIQQEINALRAADMKQFLEDLALQSELVKRKREIENDMDKLTSKHQEYLKTVNTIAKNGSAKDTANRLDRDISSYKGQLEGLKREDQSLNLQDVRGNIQKTQNKLDSMALVGELFSRGNRPKNFTDLRQRIETLTREKQKLDESKGEYIRFSSELQTLQNNLKEYDLQLAERDNFARALKEEAAKRDIAKERLKDTRSERERVFGALSSNNGRITQLDNEISDTDKKIDEIKKKESIYSFLDELKKAFSRDGIPRVIRERALESINYLTRNILSRFNLGIEDIRISEDLDIDVFQDGSEKNISQLSGGERTSISIAMRMAIAKYLGRDVSTILMDEPTVYLDEERRNDLKDILQYSMKELSDEGLFPQITIITHHQELESAADLSFHIQKVNGISEVKPVD